VGEADGKPFFSLEFVAGGSLAQKLGGTPLPALQAAQLTETLARAVEAAHQQNIIHRDLKPGNVLLTADGQPKVTDFGLAKRLDQEAGQTRSGDVLGTPSYMAPEQADGKGREVGPAADVYSLGAILYELLTGRPPFKAATPLDTMHQVVSEEPVPPARLNRQVPRDLETICLKCLRKEVVGRYPSALALAEDLRRFQNGEPIVARPVGRVERLWRWCRRNPVVAALAAALLVVLVGGLAGLTFLWRTAEDQRAAAVAARQEAQQSAAEAQRQERRAQGQARRARAEADRARREGKRANWTAQLLGEMFEGADPLGLNGIPALRPRGGETLTARQILDRASAKVARDLYLGANPRAQAKLIDTIGSVYCTLGLTARARPLLEKALRLRRRALPKDHPDIATSLHNLAWLHHQTGAYPRALRLYRQALAIRRKHARTDPVALSTTLVTLGWLLTDLEEYAAGEKLFRQALALRQRRLGPDHRDTAVARLSLAAAYIAQGKAMAALRHYRRGVATLRKIEGGKGLAASIDLFQRGVIARQLPAPVRSLLGLKDDRAVEQCLRKSLKLARKALGDHHPYVALVLHELAVTLAQHHQDQEADRYFRQCLAIAREYGLQHPKTTVVLVNYCILLKRRGRQGKAHRLLDEALKVRRRHPTNPAAIADVLLIRAAILLTDAASAPRRQHLLQQALALYCQSPGTPRRYAVACVRLLTDRLSAPDNYAVAGRLGRAARRARQREARDKFLDLAMLALRRARAKGFKDARRLRADEDLRGLRGRKDFQQLVAELEGPSGPDP
jgi:tetratricopeptide (TPR) repeat protein